MSNSFLLFMAISNSLRGVLFVFLTNPWRIKNILGGMRTKNNLI